MKVSKAIRPFFFLLLALAGAQFACCASALSSGCGYPQSSPLTQIPIVNNGELPLTPTSTITNSGLNAEGPWLLMETDQGLWAANPDGSGMAQLTDVDYWHGSLQVLGEVEK